MIVTTKRLEQCLDGHYSTESSLTETLLCCSSSLTENVYSPAGKA